MGAGFLDNAANQTISKSAGNYGMVEGITSSVERAAKFLTEDTASGKYTDPLSLNKYTYCHNQPVTGYDPDGHALNLLSGFFGGLIGGVVGGTINAASQVIQNKGFKNLKFNSKQFWGSVAEGTVTGTFAGLTFGGSLAATAGGTMAKQTVKAALKSTVKHAAIGMGAGFLGNAANQTISKGAGNYDMVEGITSSVAGAAGFMTAGMFLPAAPTGNQAVAKAAASLGKRVLSAGATGFKIGAATGLASDVSVQTAKILGGEQKRFDPFSTGLSTLAGGAVGAGVAAGAEVLANSNATSVIKNALSKLRGSKDEGVSKLASYYEYKALKLQGYKADEAFSLMQQFRKGINPDNDFLFHFTSLRGGKGITDIGGIYGSESGVWGKGVYAGTTPTPSWALKHIPFSGWGLGNTPVRIPIKLNFATESVRPFIPIKSTVIRTDFLKFQED